MPFTQIVEPGIFTAGLREERIQIFLRLHRIAFEMSSGAAVPLDRKPSDAKCLPFKVLADQHAPDFTPPRTFQLMPQCLNRLSCQD